MTLLLDIILTITLAWVFYTYGYKKGKRDGEKSGVIKGIHEGATTKISQLASSMTDPAMMLATMVAIQQAENLQNLDEHYFFLYSKKAEVEQEMERNEDIRAFPYAKYLLNNIKIALEIVDIEKERRVKLQKEEAK